MRKALILSTATWHSVQWKRRGHPFSLLMFELHILATHRQSSANKTFPFDQDIKTKNLEKHVLFVANRWKMLRRFRACAPKWKFTLSWLLGFFPLFDSGGKPFSGSWNRSGSPLSSIMQAVNTAARLIRWDPSWDSPENAITWNNSQPR